MSFDVALFTHRPGQSIQKRGKPKETRSVSEGFFDFSNTRSTRCTTKLPSKSNREIATSKSV
ncbi:MAG: hypothetical protein KDA83_14420, partial [Planctomycetales bacterium]|nr:hypothetical protein [Planctomycetales bacterium]